MPFQREGLGFLASSRRASLADEMGLGKTVQALAFLASLAAFPALVVAPPHLVRNWQSEAQRFLRLSGGVRVHVFKGLTPYAPPPADLYVIHYLLLRGWKRQLPQMGFQAVIFDEMQELRHGGTEKYSAASLLADSVENVIGLSGTPIYNAGAKSGNVINILDYHCLGDWESFTREWCYGYASNIVAKPELLGEHLRWEGPMLRRLKGQVLSQLPLPPSGAADRLNDQVYRALMRPVAAQLVLAAAQGESARAIIEDSICQTQRQATGGSQGALRVCLLSGGRWRAANRCCFFSPTITR